MSARLRPGDLRFDPPRLDLADVASVLREHWGIVGELSRLDGERDQNTHVVIDTGEAFVLKIASPSEDHAIADLQCAVLDHIATTDPSIPVPRVVADRAGRRVASVDVDGCVMPTRLLTFLPGITFDGIVDMPLSAMEAVGRFQGRLAAALVGFGHPSASAFMAWALDSGMIASDELWNELSGESRSMIEPFRERSLAAIAELHGLPRQVLHNDGHGGNLLRADRSTFEISGVIDFGDTTETAVIADLAVCAASFGEDHPDPVGALCAVTGGYHSQHPLSADEAGLLPDLVVARRVLGTLLVEYQARHAPPERLDEIAWEIPILRAGARWWGTIDRSRAIDALVETVGDTGRRHE